MDSRFLTLKEAADYLRVNRVTMFRLLRAGRLEGAFKVGRMWRFNIEAIERMTTEPPPVETSERVVRGTRTA